MIKCERMWKFLNSREVGLEAEKVKQVLEDFQIGYAMLIILAFYFGGGAAEGILQNRNRR